MAQSNAIPDDLMPFYWPLTDAERDQATSMLYTAWIRLITLSPTIPARLDAGTLDADLVSSVQAEMVANVLKNPKGLRSTQTTTTVSIDDYSKTESSNETIDRALAEGALYPTPAMLQLLAPGGPRSYTINPRPA